MKAFWLKMPVFAVVILVLIILVTVFSPSKPQPVETQQTGPEPQEAGDTDLRPESKAEKREAELHAEEKPNPKVDYMAKVNELYKAGRDEVLNAAPFYQKAIELCVKGSEEQRTLATRSWPTELSVDQQKLLKQWVESNSEALSQLELGTKKPYYWLEYSSPDGNMTGVLMPGLSEIRQLMFALRDRAKLSAAKGNIDKALADIITCYRFGLHMSDSLTLIEQLVGMACRSLAIQISFVILDQTSIGKASLEALQSKIEKFSTDESYIVDLRVERLFQLDIIQRVFTDDGQGDGRIHMESAMSILSAMNIQKTTEQMQSFQELRRRQTIQTFEDLSGYFGALVKKNPGQWKNENINPQKEIEEITADNPLVQICCPSVVRVAKIFARCKAETGALITTLALMRYKADKGRLPEKLDELVSAGYLKALPNDSFSDRPFVYKRLGEDFTLYSFGEDCDDDAGTRSEWGKGEQGGDQVFWPVQ